MNFQDWCESVPLQIRGDSLWKMEAYRLALFASDPGWHDVTRLSKDGRTNALAGQLYRSLGSIHTNLAEGYSRGSPRDRARFYEYALGSARESRDWYYDGRHILSKEACEHRPNLLTQIIRLLLTMIPQQRSDAAFREEPPPYFSEQADRHDSTEWVALSASAPLP